jgi:hypothetical protein
VTRCTEERAEDRPSEAADSQSGDDAEVRELQALELLMDAEKG